MEDAFAKAGDLSSWTPNLLDEIDRCFEKNYLSQGGEPVPYLFFPRSADNLNKFMTYCSEVDEVLRKHSQESPPWAREYFAYYSIWQMRGWGFPVPLGTKSVVGVLDLMVSTVKKGFSEVSRTLHMRTSSPCAMRKSNRR
jgi:hypothetical protein